VSEIKVQLVKSRIGTTPAQRRILDALGLRKREAIKTFNDTPAVRGMVAKVVHLVEVKAS
jgi:large subunit ribosomal protein L30